jgi:hypothetical protein
MEPVDIRTARLIKIVGPGILSAAIAHSMTQLRLPDADSKRHHEIALTRTVLQLPTGCGTILKLMAL